MNLPSKDKNGNNYLSYSQISLFKRDKEQFTKSYILKEPFIGNEYTEFGNKVGKALELNNFDGFTESEITILNQVNRLDEFERMIKINYDLFYVVGYIDSCSSDLKKIIDYKTGGYQKEYQYMDGLYNQLHYYALGIKQETGIIVKEASVEFIRRAGKKDNLMVANEKPLSIKIDLTEQSLKQVYWETIKIAKDIENFYLSHLNK